MANAIVGTLMLTGLGAVFAVPVGVISGIYVAEYRETQLANLVRFAADTLNGVPSIVIGVFVYGLVVLPFKQFSALAGGVALGIMMIPIITRTTDELLRLVPMSLREGALALGATRARAVFTVVLPAALPGIMTGIVLALARVAGRDGAAALHRLQQPLLEHEPDAADLLADRADLHVRHLAVRRLAPPGVGGRAGARDDRPGLLAARAPRHAAARADARRTVIDTCGSGFPVPEFRVGFLVPECRFRNPPEPGTRSGTGAPQPNLAPGTPTRNRKPLPSPHTKAGMIRRLNGGDCIREISTDSA